MTRDPSGTLLLLETLPGIKARQLRSTYSDRAVERFFAFLLKRQSDPVHSHQAFLLQELLADSYDPRFKHALIYIEPSTLTAILPDRIGEGTFGRVYQAEWTAKPVRHGAVDDTAPGPVALKVAHGRSNRFELDQAKFFDEVSRISILHSYTETNVASGKAALSSYRSDRRTHRFHRLLWLHQSLDRRQRPSPPIWCRRWGAKIRSCLQFRQ